MLMFPHVPHARTTNLGFTLAELLITVALVCLVAAIAFPNLLRSRIAANEGAAVASIRAINQAQAAYAAAFPTAGFASSLSELKKLETAPCYDRQSPSSCLIDPSLINATSLDHGKNGYWFAVSPAEKDPKFVVRGYVASAAAVVFNKTGVRDFCSVEDGIFHFRVPDSQSSVITSHSECQAKEILH